jgi:hypothetical protein
VCKRAVPAVRLAPRAQRCAVREQQRYDVQVPALGSEVERRHAVAAHRHLAGWALRLGECQSVARVPGRKQVRACIPIICSCYAYVGVVRQQHLGERGLPMFGRDMKGCRPTVNTQYTHTVRIGANARATPRVARASREPLPE